MSPVANQPSMHHCAGRFVVVIVAAHDVGAAHEQFAVVAEPHFDVGIGRPTVPMRASLPVVAR